MDIRNRLADISKLRCHVCQDYIRFILPPNWQQLVYQKAKSEVEFNTKYRTHYIAIYEKMRDVGFANYRIDDMDITIISELLHGCKSFIKAAPKVVEAIETIRNDRNSKDHSGENEDPEELYLEGLLALCSLRSFVRTVDKYERGISDEDRLLYRQKYIADINTLKEILDEERIELVQKTKAMDLDIQKILQSKRPLETWIKIEKYYMDKYWEVHNDPDSYFEFVVYASDSGIIYAHDEAANYFAEKKDFQETERRLYMFYKAFAEKSDCTNQMRSIIDTINICLLKGCVMCDGFIELVEKIKDLGFNITQADNGLYIWNRKHH